MCCVLFTFIWLIDSPTKHLSRWTLLILAATVVAVFMLVILTVIITCVIRKACFSKVSFVTYRYMYLSPSLSPHPTPSLSPSTFHVHVCTIDAYGIRGTCMYMYTHLHT